MGFEDGCWIENVPNMGGINRNIKTFPYARGFFSFACSEGETQSEGENVSVLFMYRRKKERR